MVSPVPIVEILIVVILSATLFFNRKLYRWWAAKKRKRVWAFIIVIALLIGVLLWKFKLNWDWAGMHKEARNRTVCGTNLKTIDTAMYMYGEDHKGQYPPKNNWRQPLVKEGYIHNMKLFICPSVGGDPDKEPSYIYRGPASTRSSGNRPVLHDRKNNHSYPTDYSSGRVGRNVVGSAHGVEFLKEEEFQERIRQDNAKRQEMGLEPIPAED